MKFWNCPKFLYGLLTHCLYEDIVFGFKNLLKSPLLLQIGDLQTNFYDVQWGYRTWFRRQNMKLLIWWLTRDEIDQAYAHKEFKYLPNYIYAQLETRYSEPGGLWIDDSIESIPEVDWDNNELALKLKAADTVGVVFYAADLIFVQNLPGMVTDFDLNIQKSAIH